MQRRHRLSRSRDFDAVYRHGRSVSTRYLTLYSFAREASDEDAGDPRLGLAVSRKTGNAVTRNRIKRQLREAWTLLLDEVPAGPRLRPLGARGPAGRRRGARPGVARRARAGSARKGARVRYLGDRRRVRLPLHDPPALPGGQLQVLPDAAPRTRSQALKEYGLLRGSILAAWRLLRCNPWSHGGVDHVHDQRLFA